MTFYKILKVEFYIVIFQIDKLQLSISNSLRETCFLIKLIGNFLKIETFSTGKKR